MGWPTRDPQSQKEETEIQKIKFGVDQAYIEQDTAIQILQNLLGIKPDESNYPYISY